MRSLFFFIILLSFTLHAIGQQRQVADQIVAMVNDHIILQSDVDQRVFEFMQQMRGEEFDERMWYYVLESMIDNFVLIEQGRIDSVIVSDSEVDRILSQRIDELVQQLGSERELERAFGQSIVEIKAEYADQFRQDLMVNRVRQSKISRISITRPEVIDFFNAIPEDSLPIIPESVSLSQITVIPPPKLEARENARALASQLRDSVLHYGVSLEDLAIRYSDGPTARQGGGLPMVNATDLLPEYAAAAGALEPGQISEVVSTQQGFHVIRLNERQGQRISTHHILISVPEDALDEEYARNKLTAVRDSILHMEQTFAGMARRYSDDRNTGPAGGRLVDPQSGQRLIPVSDLDPSLYRTVLMLEEPGDISPPRSYQYGEDNKRAFRIVKLNERIEEHLANLEQDYQLIRSFALQQKSQRILAEWLMELRNEMFVEYRIPVPEYDPMDMPDPLTPEVPTDTGMPGDHENLQGSH